MKLLLKFNLVFLLVFALGLGVSAFIARDLLRSKAEAEVVDRARLLMEKADVVSTYTAKQIAPLLQTQMNYSFLPQSVPSYSAMEVLGALGKSYPEYFYKAAMLNPTNPRDKANDWEEDVVNQFKTTEGLKEYVGQRDTPTGRALYIARPIRINDGACLRCHSSPDAAPKPLVDRYGPSNGFGWKTGEVLGARIVSVPLTVPLQQADHAFAVVMGLLAAVFLLIGGTLNLMLWKLVIQPVTRLSALSDRVSRGDLEAPDFGTGSRDEIGVLADSFGRMRKSLVHAMKLLDS
jgi:HAMP domain-containing protein